MSNHIIKNAKILRIFLFLLIFSAVTMLSPMGTMQVNADTVMTTVSVGNIPQRVVVNETTNRIYVTSGDIDAYPSPIAGEVTVINGSDYSIITTAAIGGTPKGMTVDEANNKIYVANMRSNSVVVVNGNTNTVSTLAEYINRPIALALNPTTSALFVAQNINDGGLGYITVLNSGTGSITTTLTVDKNPSAIALNGKTNKIYVAHEDLNTVTVIDGDSYTTEAALTVGSYPESIAVNETTNKIYVANSWSNSVSVINGDSNEVTETISVGGGPWGVAVNEKTNKIYVANQMGRSVSVIDGATSTVVQTLTVPDSQSSPIAAAVDQTCNKIYVSSIGSNHLTVIDGAVIETASITGLTAPAAGGAPQTAGALTSGNSRYIVTGLTWKNLNDGSPATLSGGNFANAGNTYKAEIVLTAEPNYKFPTGLTPTVNAGASTAGAISGDALENTLTFEVTFPADITTTSLGGLIAPTVGATPAVLSDLISGNPVEYTVTSLSWEEAGGTSATLDGSGKYIYGGSWYQARVVLTSQPGYKFAAGGLTPDVDGDGTAAAGTVSGGNVTGNTLTFVVSFSAEISDSYATIFGLVPPEAGGTPQSKNAAGLSPNNPWSCTLSALTWQNSDGSPATLSGGAFITGGSTYKAVIELTSLEGYKFPLGGVTPEVYEDGTFVSGVVTGGYFSGNKFTFVATFSNDITAAGITGLVAPAAGSVPVAEDDLTAAHLLQYDVDYVDWQNSAGSSLMPGEKFNANSAYKAVIYLESCDGFKFPMDGLTLTVNTGTPGAVYAPYSYVSGNTIAFEVTFPTTGAITTDTSGTGSGGGGDGGTSQESPKPVGEISENTYTATTTVTAKTDSRGNTTATVTKTQLSDAINKAVKEANKLGNDTNAVVEIKVEAPAASGSVTTSIPKDALGLVVNGGTDVLKVSTPLASLSFDTAALTTIFGEAAGDVSITASKVDAVSLSVETRQLVGDRPVFNFSVTSGNQTISQFNGNVTASVPYTLKANEDPNSIVIYYINAQGQPEMVSNCAYDPTTGTVSFTTDHFSQYAVGYNKVSFNDVKTGAWYENAVGFAAARGIVTGTGNGNYGPSGKLTRGQLLVMLMRAYGIEPDKDLSGNFSDAGNTYYTGYLAVAKRLGITEGLGNNLYAPEKQITRQEMFTLLYNTLKEIDQLPEGIGGADEALTGYSDVDTVATWAKDAFGTLANAGVISGSDGKLSPKNTTTRAEMAQVIYNLLSK